MTPFYYQTASVDGALSDDLSSLIRPLAGGTDLLPRIKLGLEQPAALVDLKTSSLDDRIEAVDGGWRIGALATLSRIRHHDGLERDAPALGQALAQAATVQVRNRATLAGNLLQRPRCWYFRNEDLRCWLSGGEGCPARTGRNEHHGVFEASPCVAVHPSDAAAVLVALGATVAVVGRRGERELTVAELLAPPTEDRRLEHVLGDDEVIVSITVPTWGTGSVYLKAMDRAAWAFALVGVAAAVEMSPDGTVDDVRLVASGVANVPWRLTTVENQLRGGELSGPALDRAAELSGVGATPLAENGYKLPLLQGLIRRALEQLDTAR